MRDGQGPGILLTEPALFKFHRYLLLLTHARSYSTLLCHILGSHPQICGYTEAMIPYKTAVDLIRLNREVFRAGNYRSDCEYVVDKLLYDNFDVSDVVLHIPRVTPFLIIREPESAIASLVRMRAREYEQGIADWTGGWIDLRGTPSWPPCTTSRGSGPCGPWSLASRRWGNGASS